MQGAISVQRDFARVKDAHDLMKRRTDVKALHIEDRKLPSRSRLCLGRLSIAWNHLLKLVECAHLPERCGQLVQNEKLGGFAKIHLRQRRSYQRVLQKLHSLRVAPFFRRDLPET